MPPKSVLSHDISNNRNRRRAINPIVYFWYSILEEWFISVFFGCTDKSKSKRFISEDLVEMLTVSIWLRTSQPKPVTSLDHPKLTCNRSLVNGYGLNPRNRHVELKSTHHVFLQNWPKTVAKPTWTGKTI